MGDRPQDWVGESPYPGASDTPREGRMARDQGRNRASSRDFFLPDATFPGTVIRPLREISQPLSGQILRTLAGDQRKNARVHRRSQRRVAP
jgi:hypothetical protein